MVPEKKVIYNKKELKIGAKIEMEHTTSKKKATKIAKDHLREFPNYYTAGVLPMEKKLKAMELKKVASSKDLVKAGLTLGVGFRVLPFINFKDAKNYSPFNKDNKSESKKWLK